MQKGVYRYEDMNDWENFYKTSSPEKYFYSYLNMEDITDADYTQGKRVVCHSKNRYSKANKKYMEFYDENKESTYFQYWDVNNLYGWAMLQIIPVNNFEWIEYTSKFNEDFIKNCNEESYEGCSISWKITWTI